MNEHEISIFLKSKNISYKCWDFDFEEPLKNPDYEPSDEPDDVKWIQELYSNILIIEIDENDEGIKHWLDQFEKGVTRKRVEQHFKSIAKKENERRDGVKFSALVDDDDKGRRIAVVMPESAGDVLMTTSLLPSIKELYPEHNIYFVTKPPFDQIVFGNPYVHKVLPWVNSCDSLLAMEGNWENDGLFEICYLPYVGTQRHLNYLHNGKDIIELELRGDSSIVEPKENIS